MESLIYLAAGEPDSLFYPAARETWQLERAAGEPVSLVYPAAGEPVSLMYPAAGGPVSFAYPAAEEPVYLGRHTWPAMGIPGQLREYLVTWRLPKPTWAAIGTRAPIGILGDILEYLPEYLGIRNFEGDQPLPDSHRNTRDL